MEIVGVKTIRKQQRKSGWTEQNKTKQNRTVIWMATSVSLPCFSHTHSHSKMLSSYFPKQNHLLSIFIVLHQSFMYFLISLFMCYLKLNKTSSSIWCGLSEYSPIGSGTTSARYSRVVHVLRFSVSTVNTINVGWGFFNFFVWIQFYSIC